MVANNNNFVPLDHVRQTKRVNARGSFHGVDLNKTGEEETVEYRIQATCSSKKHNLSLWHDISLVHLDPKTKEETPFMNFVCEIPKFTR